LAETTFAVTYEGSALVDGRMPVQDLAPALLSLGELFTEASALVYPDREPVALDIRATQEGSFEIDLILTARDAWNHFVDFFGSDGASAVANLFEIVGGAAGLFFFVKHLHGRRVVARERVPESGKVRLDLDDGTVIEVSTEVLALYENVQVRERARAVVEPLRKKGVARLIFKAKQETTVTIEQESVPAYDLPEPEEISLSDDTVEMAVSIASVAFTEGNKWRFSDGENTFYATIEDGAFLERIDHGIEAFRKGDILRCRMRVIQSQSEEGLHTERRVVEVTEHIRRGIQLRLREGEDDPSTSPPG